MLHWIQNHTQVLNTVANFGMLLVWIAYLQLFLQNFRRQRRAHILINRGAGRDLTARCLISNMSSEAIYIETIVARLCDEGQVTSCAVTDVVRPEGESPSRDPRLETRQGPLSAGGYMDVGSFCGILDQVVRNTEEGHPCVPEHPFEVEVLVIADYASENLVVGARRRFEVKRQQGRFVLNPVAAGTEQIRSRRERRRLEDLKQEYL